MVLKKYKHCTDMMVQMIEKGKNIGAIILLLFLEWFFFRNIIGTDMLIGDRGDGRLCTLITEHWYKVFFGRESFSELGMFFPASNELGYSDMLLGYGFIHSIFRIIGLDIYSAYKYTLVLVHVIGTVVFFQFLKCKCKLDIWWSLLGTMAFSFANTYSYKAGHTQLFALSIIPVILFLVVSFFQNLDCRAKKNIYAYAFITVSVLLVYTSWYIAFFSGLFCLTWFVVYFLILLFHREFQWNKYSKFAKKIGKDIIGYLVYGVLLMLPFVMVYIPVFKEAGERSWKEVSVFLPEIVDIINVTPDNWMLGKIVKKLQLKSGELSIGFSIVLLVLFLITYFYARKNIGEAKEKDQKMLLCVSIMYTVFISVCFTIKLSSNGVSLWYIFYKFIPGASSIRAVSRYLFFLTVPISVVVAIIGNKIMLEMPIRKKRYSFFMITLIVVLFYSNIYGEGVNSFWNKAEEERNMSAVSVPPDECESFYIIDSSKEKKPDFIYQLDAFEIASAYSIPTLNGYSGQAPKDWKLWNVCDEDYESRVNQWISKNDLKNVYFYDVALNEWSKHMKVERFYPAANIFPCKLLGLQDWNQGEFTWSGQIFSTILTNPNITTEGLLLKIGTQNEWYLKQQPDVVPRLELYIDDMYIQELPVIDGYAEYRIPVLANPDHTYKVELRTNAYFSPKDLGLSDDPRELSLAIYYIGE